MSTSAPRHYDQLSVRHPDGRAVRQRIGGIALLATILLVNACGQTKTPTPAPAPQRQVTLDVSCGELPVVGVYVHAEQKNGTAPGGFASWYPEQGDPTRAVAVAAVPIGTVAVRVDVGCGGTPQHWGINSHQDTLSLSTSSMFAVNCDFTAADLPESGLPTENLANACTVTPLIPVTAGR